MATTPQRRGRARQNSWALIPGATGRDVGRGEVGGRRAVDLVAQAVQPVAEQVPLGGQLAGERTEGVGGKAQAVRHRELEGSRAGVGEELLGRPHRGDQRRGGTHPSHLPTREGEGLAARGDGHRALRHAGQRGQGDVGTLEDEVLVDLVGDRQDVVGPAQRGDLVQLVGAEHLAGRVVR